MADISSFRSFNHEMGMEDLLFCQQWSLDSIDELSSLSNMASIFCEDFNPSYDYSTNSRQPDLKRAPAEWSSQVGGDVVIRPVKQLKYENKSNSLPPPNHTTCNNDIILPSISHVGTVVKKLPYKEETWYSNSPTSNTIITFGEQICNVPKSCEEYVNITTNSTIATTTATRVPSAQERMLAERKRRERLTQKFIALSALVPGLKKMDKTSVLGDAIKYLKQLEDKVKNLEGRQQTNKRYKLDNCDSDRDSSSDKLLLPEIMTRLCNKEVLIHIHCERKKGALEITVAEIEKLNLSVVNSSVLSFGESALNISLVAQMDEKFTSEMNKELVKNLNKALSR